MPISPIVLQRRHAELGRIRLGAKEPTSNGGTRPAKLAAFRFTSASQRYIEDLAALYGGDPQPWDNNGVASWEVFTTAQSIPVIAVKGGLSQWMETWSGGGCVHRCDGERTVEGDYCENDTTTVKVRVNGQWKTVPAHDAAKPTTRLSVMLPELEAIGVWRMETHGWNAAAEIPAVAELAQYVGDLVPANLNLVERRSVRDGKTSRFVVPVLDLQIGTARLKEIVAAKSGGELEAGPAGGGQRALEAGPSAPAADPYADFRQMVADAASLEELAGVWDLAKDNELVGQASQPSQAREAFVEAFKARAHEIKAQQPVEQPAPAASSGEDQDADTVWQRILATAGSFDDPWTTSRVVADYEARYAMNPAEASAGELTAYLEVLKAGVPA